MFVIASAVMAAEPATKATSPAPTAPPVMDAPVLAALVQQLGDDSFSQRRRASQELAAKGSDARAVIQAGLRNSDPEIRRSCRRLLVQLIEADFQRRLEELLADNDAKREHALPCWKRYAEVFGKDQASRRLFVEMQRAEPVLLESAEVADELATQVFRLRWQQVMQAIYGNNFASTDGGANQQPSFASLAAMIFVAVDTQVKIPAEVANNSMFWNVFHQAAFQQALGDEARKPMARKLLARWILQPTGPAFQMQKLQLAMQHQLKEALGTAIELLKAPAPNNNPQMTACGIEAVARLGGKPYAALLVPLLKENRECIRQMMVVNGKQEARVVELRDVALAWLVEVTGQDHAQYDMPEVKQWFENVRKFPQNGFNYYNLGFRDTSKRDAALKKLEEWLKSNPLPEPPKPGAEAVPLPAAPNVAAVPATPKPVKEPAEAVPVVGVPLADRAQSRKLTQARRLIEQQSYGDAVDLLGDVLAAPSDYAFKPDQTASLYRRLKPAAEDMLAQLPEEGLKAYERQFGALARQRLAGATATGDPSALAKVVECFFFTEAGAEAAYLLGMHHRQAGRSLRAAFCLRRLESDARRADRFQPALSVELATCYLKARMPREAREVLLRLKAANPALAVHVAGQERKLFDGEQAAQVWLEAVIGRQPAAEAGWAMFGGGPSRGTTSSDSHPFLRPKYKVQTHSDALLQASIQALGDETRQARRAAVPGLGALVVGQTVLLRTATEVRAVDSGTGAVRWETPLDDSLASFLAFSDADKKTRAAETIKRGLRRRLWEDHAFGTMSSDGRHVFGLEYMPFDLGTDNQAMTVLPDGRRQLAPGTLTGYNLLTAYDVRTGKLAWEAGGPPGAPAHRLAGAFVLGPPLPLDDQLYVVAELQDQTRLFALQPATGDVLGEWLLAMRDETPQPTAFWQPWQTAFLQQRRGVAGPAFAEGVLVCCTQENRYVGVDLANGSVLWVYEAQQVESVNPMNPMQAQMKLAARVEGWCDAGMTIAAGHVLLTPLGSDQLVCLRLADGRQAWSAARRDGLYVGGVHEGQVLVVGRRGLRALRLADGVDAWPNDASWPAGAVTSGRGFLGTTRYHVPLSTAEIAVVDLGKGVVAARSRSADGIVPGNLVHCQGAIFSLGADALYRFDLLGTRQEEVETALRDHPEDGKLLAESGELLLAQGRQWEAVEKLRAALKVERTERTQQLLAEGLAEGLRLDFDKFRPLAEEIERLLEKPEWKSRVLQELALGYRRSARNRAALEVYLKWIDLIADAGKLVETDRGNLARTDRLVQAGLAELWASAAAEDRQELDRRITARLRDDDLPRFLGWFGFHPSAHDARLRLARRYLAAAKAEDKRYMEAELLLRRVLTSGTAPQQREATARMGGLLREAGRPEDAAAYYRRLAGPLSGEECLDGKPGRELVAALPEDDAVRRVLFGPGPWPAGKIKKDFQKRQPDQARMIHNLMPVWTADYDRSWSLAFTSEGQVLQQRGRQGQVYWKLPVTDVKVHPQAMGYLYQNSEACSTGHLLVAVLGNRVAAIDTFGGADGDGKPPKGKLLWAHDTPSTNIQQTMAQMQWPRRRFQGQRQAKPLTTALPAPVIVTAEYVCFEQDRKLMAVDPIRGETLWVFEDLEPDTDLFGDEELAFTTRADANEAVVLSAIDGREVGRRAVPPLGKRLMTRGRHVLTWDTGAKQAELTLFDPWTQKTVWQKSFHAKAHIWPLDRDELGVLSPRGEFAVVSLDKGDILLTAQVDPVESLDGIVVRRCGEGYVLLTNRPDPQPNPFGRFTQPGYADVGGWAHAFDDKGGKLWSAPLPTQAINPYLPEDLPVLFLQRRYMKAQQLPNGGFQGGQLQSEIFCLDLRTGKALHEDTVAQNEWYDVTVDPGRQIEFYSNRESLKLTFPTADPAPKP